MSDELKAVVEMDDVEYKAVLASVLDRGYAHEALNIDLPPHLTGEWITNDPVSIARAKTLGFTIDTEYAKKNSIHSSGDSKAVYGDVIFMTIPTQRKRIIDEVRKETARRRLGDKVDDKLKNQGEETQFKGQMRDLETVGITAIDAPSQSHVVDGTQIAAALSQGQS
jgi:hypothetical protein